MFERYLLNAERSDNILNLFIGSFLITFFVCVVNIYLNLNSLFLVSLVSLALCYPIVNYVREMDVKEVKGATFREFIRIYGVELQVFWVMFLGVLLGFFIGFHFINGLNFHEYYVNSITGNFLSFESTFFTILSNNLLVLVSTILISSLFFSGLVLVLVWNASLISYYLFSLESYSGALLSAVLLLSHGFFEIGGYVIGGIVGSLIGFEFDKREKIHVKLVMNFLFLILFSVILIVIGAIIESS